MEKVKSTKNELKLQRDALARYLRYLPTLELKKMQLQKEIGETVFLIRLMEEEERKIWGDLAPWDSLFGEDIGLDDYLSITGITQSYTNICGVEIPIFNEVLFQEREVDYLKTPPWLDDGIEVSKLLLKTRVELSFLKKQKEILSNELLVTCRRVSLFEKVKVPEAQENIRRIRIFLGDEQRAQVIRAKISKRKIEKKRGEMA